MQFEDDSGLLSALIIFYFCVLVCMFSHVHVHVVHV